MVYNKILTVGYVWEVMTLGGGKRISLSTLYIIIFLLKGYISFLQLEIIVLSEVSQTEKDKYHMISRICGI